MGLASTNSIKIMLAALMALAVTGCNNPIGGSAVDTGFVPGIDPATLVPTDPASLLPVPNLLTLLSPSSSPAGDTTPTIRVSGVSIGLTIYLYTDSICLTSVGSATAPASYADITTSVLPTASYTFYARSYDSASSTFSACSTASVDYTVDLSLPTVDITSPVANSYINNSTKTAFTVSGTCSENTLIVTVVAGGAVTATPTCTAGAWTTTMDVSSLADGTVTFTADHVDAAANVANQASRNFNKDTVAPAAPSGLALLSPATSPSNDTTPTITVSGVASGLTVAMFSDNTCSTQTASGTAVATTIDLTSSVLVAGTYGFYANSTDVAGNTSTCSAATVAYTLDLTAPTVAITSPAANSYINNATKAAFTVSGTCSENTRTVTVVAGGTVTATPTCTAGAWTTTMDVTSIADGTVTFTADHSDAAGNAATQDSRNFIKDIVAPTAPSGLALNSPATSPNSDTTPTITVSGVANGLTVAMFSDNTCSTQKATGSAAGVTIDLTSSVLVEAAYTFYANATDAAGNTSTCSVANVAYTVDLTPPTVAITAPAALSYINNATKAAFTVSGTCSENTRTVTVVAGGAVTATPTCTAGAWTTTMDVSSIADGTITFTADHTDASLNAAVQATRDFEKDVVAPTAPSALTLLSPATSPGNDTTPTVTVSGVASGLTVAMFSDNTCVTQKATGTAAGVTIDLTSSVLTDNAYSFYANATDAAGNTSTCSVATVAYTLDTSLPTVAITSPAALSYINNATKAAFTVSGTCSEDTRTVTVVAGGTVTATPTCTVGAWTATMDVSSIADGTIALTADHTDAAGNAAIQSTRNFIKDIVAPTAPSGLALSSPATSPGNDTTPTITVSGVANGLTVAMFSDNTCSTQKSTGTAAGVTIDLTSSVLTDATYAFYANATDPAGNISTCSVATVAYVLDTAAPTVAITAPAALSYINNAGKTAFTISGTCSEDTRTVTVVAGGTVTATPTCTTGTWTTTMDVSSIADGTVTFTADHTDASGNAAVQSTRDFEKDTVAPTAPSGLALNSPATSPGSDTTPTITVSGVANGLAVAMFSDNTCSTQKATGTAAGVTIDLTSSALTDATYAFYANATDAAGNTSTCSVATVAYVLDTAAPTVAITAPAALSYINNATKAAFTVSGTCSEDTRTVTVVAGGTVTATPTCTTGTWTTTMDVTSIADGTITFTADHTDASLNAAVQATRDFEKDTVAPTAPSGLALNSPATSPGSDTTPTITVSGVANGLAVAMFSDNTCSTQKATGTAAGVTIDLTSSALTDATYAFYANATDAAGNTSTCSVATVAYVLDTAVPTVAITAPAAFSYINNATKAAFTVSGTCSEDTRTVTVVAGGTVTATPTCTTGTWTTTMDVTSIADGTITFTADHTDAAANAAVQATRDFEKDTVAPSAPSGLALSSPATSPSSDTTPTITVSGVANGLTVAMFSDNTCSTQKASGTAAGVTIDLTSSVLSEATYAFYANATDAAGNTSTCSVATVAYVLDTSAPTVAITAPAALSYINNATKAAFTVSGTCSEDTRTVTVVAGGVVTATPTCTTGTWTTTMDVTSIADGTITFTADHTDAAANAAVQSTRDFEKDVVAPSAPSGLALSSPATSPGNDTTPTITVSGVANGLTVAMFSDNTCSTQKATGAASGVTIDLTSSALTDATYAFYANATDPAGNISTCSVATVAYVLDTAAPTVAITAPAALSYINNATKAAFTVSGTCSEDTRTVTVVAGGTVTATPTCTTGTWTTTMDVTSIADGTITFTADHTDASLNAAVQATRDFEKDTVAPTAPSGLALSVPATSPSSDTTPAVTISGVTSGLTVAMFSDNTCSTQKATGTAAGVTIDLTSSALTDATYAFYANATDAAGNTSTCSVATVAYTVDTTVPTVAITAPAALSYINNATKAAFTVSGTCSEDTRTVTVVAGGTVTATPTCTTGTWTTTMDVTSIADGTVTFTADHTDASLNAAVQATRDFEKDVVAPSAPSGLALSSPATSPGSDTTPTITVSGVANGLSVAMFSDNTCSTQKATGAASGVTIDLTSSALTDATYAFYANATDAAGNISTCSVATVAYTVDTTVPTVAITAPAALSYINNATKAAFTVSGTCSEDTRTVTVVAGGVVTETPTCTAGAWTTTMDVTSIADGTITFTADHTDASLNAAVQATRDFEKDVVAPSAPSGLALSSPATSPGNDTTPTITVSGVASGLTVAMFSDNTCSTQKATGTAAGVTIDLTSSVLAEATYGFYANATDAAGNTSTCSVATVAYVLDTSAPTVAITAPAALSYINNATKAAFTVSGTCSEDTRTVTVVAGGTVTATPTCTAGAWTTAMDVTSIADGTITFTADHTDASLNAAVQSTRDFIKDIVAPSAPSGLALSSPATSPGSDTTPTITVSGVANGLAVAMFSDNTCSTQKATGTAAGVTIDLTSSALTDATYAFYANATDAAGNTSTCSVATVAYVLDTAVPTVAITAPAANSYINNATKAAFTVSGTCSEDTRTVTVVAGGTVTATPTCTTGTWTTNMDVTSIADGTITFTADHTDASLNAAVQSTRDFIKDIVAPSAPSGLALSSPASSPATDTTPTITVSGVANGLTVTMFSDNTCSTQKATGAASGVTIDLTSSALTDATYAFYANATDAAGNISTCSVATVSYELDTTAPSAPSSLVLQSPATSPASDTTPTITVGGVASGLTVELFADSSCTLPALKSSGTASGATIDLTSSVLAVDTTYNFYAKATDALGNASACSTATVAYVLDTTPPAAPSALSLSSPATSPGSDSTPTITVSGVASGYTVAMFSDNTCSTQKATGTASGVTIDLTSSALTEASYSFYANATDAAGNVSTCSTATVAYEYDASGPTVTGLSNDAVATNSKVWTWGCSEASCTYIYVVDQTSNTSPSGSFDGTITTTQNTGNGTYYLHVQAKDASGNLSAVVHVSALIDTTAPTAPTSVNDALYKNSLTQSTAITWGASTDTNGISRYDYAVGTTAGATDVLTWTAGTSSTSLTISSGLSLTTDTTYFVTVRAVDTAGNISTAANSDGWIADTTLPGAPTSVTLGSVPSNLTDSPTVSWTAPSDSSGIASYQVQVYKASDNSVVKAWGTSTSGSAITGMTLTAGTAYYVKVRATDGAGNVGTSYGQSSNWTTGTCVAGSTTFAYTGSSQTFTVPAICTSITVKLWGAGGGGYTSFKGGGGGFVNIPLTVTAGESLTVIVGGGGLAVTGDVRSGAGGGGRSAIQRSGADIATAGGGGGASKSARGGAGGANTGETGATNSAASGGGGGTQSAGGAGSTGATINGVAGSQYTGGYCDTTVNSGSVSGAAAYGGGGAAWSVPAGSATVGGAGGGGYYGGGGGGARTTASGGGSGGGGGSNYAPGATTNAQGSVDASGGAGDGDYSAGIGAGGVNANGGNGYIKISY